MVLKTLERVAEVSYQRLVSIGVWALGFSLLLDFTKNWILETIAINPAIIGLILVGLSSFFIIREDTNEKPR